MSDVKKFLKKNEANIAILIAFTISCIVVYLVTGEALDAMRRENIDNVENIMMDIKEAAY